MLNPANSKKWTDTSLVAEVRATMLLDCMTLDEKIGQLCQLSGNYGYISEELADSIRRGHAGSIINEVEPQVIDQLQRLSIEESRLGIPLLIGRDVIHGFNTIFPIPLGQAATWSPQSIEKAARISAIEASSIGVNWTFAPMIDITRDPRWGRIAESLGEDPYLCAELGCAMIKGFQGVDLADEKSIAACAKHFAGYGAAESGRDYNTANIPEVELRNTYLPPFKAAVDAGVSTLMSAFNDLNGVPATANTWLMNDVLRSEWSFNGLVVSDWESVSQLITHGLCENKKDAALAAAEAQIDMEMVSDCYWQHLPQLINEKRISESHIDQMVLRILTTKFSLGLFDNIPRGFQLHEQSVVEQHLAEAKDLACKSCVLLKNNNRRLPLIQQNLASIAVIGPLANDDYEQLGTWIFDGDEQRSVNCLDGIVQQLDNQVHVHFAAGMETSRSNQQQGFAEAISAAEKSDVAIMVMGEESILSGEAHSRADIGLPGCQELLIREISKTGTPIVLVVMAGRPITLEPILADVDALLFAWHPGSMGGAAISDLLFGRVSPSGKLPVTFPRKVGQIPIYYAQKNTGKPPSDESFIHMNDIQVRAPQTSLGMTATHLDTHFSPLFPFGFGLSYAKFEYANLALSSQTLKIGESIEISADVSNVGECDAEEIVQLYIRDKVGSITRPIKELKGFDRVSINKGDTITVSFTLHTDELGFFGRDGRFNTEPGEFQIWLGGSSEAELTSHFTLQTPHPSAVN